MASQQRQLKYEMYFKDHIYDLKYHIVGCTKASSLMLFKVCQAI